MTASPPPTAVMVPVSLTVTTFSSEDWKVILSVVLAGLGSALSSQTVSASGSSMVLLESFSSVQGMF